MRASVVSLFTFGCSFSLFMEFADTIFTLGIATSEPTRFGLLGLAGFARSLLKKLTLQAVRRDLIQ